MVEHNHDETIHFLKWHSPEGLWTLTAIPPDGGRTNTAQFDFKTEGDCRTWLERQHAAQNNIYFMTNPPMGPLKEKAKKEHVKELAWLHVDLDAKGAGDQSAALGAILDKLSAFNPPPSTIVMSGGGYQAFWRLQEAVFLGGDLDACAEVEAYNIQLSNVLGGDHCHNVDRIMRLPGTVNFPDAKKRKRGRVEALAAIVDLTDRLYPLADFKAAPRTQKDSGGGAPTDATKVSLSGNLPVTPDLETLGPQVKDCTKALIVQGHDPTDPNAHGSRSEAVWAVICDLVRAGVADDVIAGILLDKDYGISEHIYDQRRPVDYTARQISRAKDEAFHPALREMNDQFAVIDDGSKARVLYQRRDLTDPTHSVYSAMAFEDFQKLHIKQIVVGTKDGVEVKRPIGKWWLDQEQRRQFEGWGCWPKQPEVFNGLFNLWRGFAFEPKAGSCELFLEHVRRVICRGDDEHAVYVLKWLAFAFQFPERPAEVALVLRGLPGVGKSMLGNTMVKLFGQHGRQITSSKQLTGKFNAFLRHCVFLFADEAVAPTDKHAVATMKGLITEPKISVEGKYKDADQVANLLHVIIASNDDAIVAAGAYERRYAVFDVSAAHIQDLVYFKNLQHELDNGGYEALLHHLLHKVDLTDWHPRQNVPQTKALRDQQARAWGPEDSFLFELINRAMLPRNEYNYASDIHTKKKPLKEKNVAYSDDMAAYACVLVPEMRDWPRKKLGMMYRDLGAWSRTGANGLQCWVWPPVLDMRAIFEAKFGPQDWSGPAVWGAVIDGGADEAQEPINQQTDIPF